MPAPAAGSPCNLVEAFFSLVESRSGLIRIESQAAIKKGVRRAALTVGACFCLLFAWILLLVAGIQVLAEVLNWPWSWVAGGVALLHLVLGIVMALAAKSRGVASFPATREEFKKDREWIANFRIKKSNG
ncbi:MAG: phage holin family protein [Akkermansiaceae bacterium]